MRNNTVFVLLYGLSVLALGTLALFFTFVWIAVNLGIGNMHSAHPALAVMFWFGAIVMYVVGRGDAMYGKQAKWYRHGAEPVQVMPTRR